MISELSNKIAMWCLKHFDKILHCLVNIIVVSALKYISPLFAVLFALGLSLFKEMYDSTQKGNKFDIMDLSADLVGILIGLL